MPTRNKHFITSHFAMNKLRIYNIATFLKGWQVFVCFRYLNLKFHEKLKSKLRNFIKSSTSFFKKGYQGLLTSNNVLKLVSRNSLCLHFIYNNNPKLISYSYTCTRLNVLICDCNNVHSIPLKLDHKWHAGQLGSRSQLIII